MLDTDLLAGFYRGMRVAVKEFLRHSVAADVRHDLSVLCHHYSLV